MADLPRVLLALLPLVGLTTAIIPGLFLGGPAGVPGNGPLFGSLLGGNPSGRGLGGAGPGLLPGLSLQPGKGRSMTLGGGFGPPPNPLLNLLLGGLPPGSGSSNAVGAPGGNEQDEARPPAASGGVPSASTSAGSSGTANSPDSSEEQENKKPSSPSSSGSRSSGRPPSGRGAVGSSGSGKDGDSSEENSPSGRRRSRKKSTRGSGGSRVKEGSSEEAKTQKKKDSNEDGADSDENERSEKPSKRRGRRRGSGGRSGRGRRREKRSFMDEFGLMGTKGAHHALDNVPDHVKVVYCGRHEVPNPGGIEDHFCHPDATWDTLLRMRPDCVCQQGFLRNSWGECISPAECDHCSDKHHLNMDYHLCESPCPIVCNQPIDENCPNTCFKECACRPGYIRAYPNGPCVSIKQCLPGCRGPNQIFSLCSSLCPPTCRKPVPKRCPKICAGEGCVCKPGYVVKTWEPLVCVRPEDCPGRRKKCPGPNQRYSRCIRRCVPSCFKRRHRYCGHECLGRGCVCKRGYVVLQRRPLVCVRKDECPARRKKCPARNQVYMYCKSKCPRKCGEPKPRKCRAGCGGEGCACKPGYVIKQEDPLVCVRRYQCDLEDMGHKGVKGAMGAKGAVEAKGAMGDKELMGATGAIEAIGAKGAMGAKGSMGATEPIRGMGDMGTKGAMGVKGAKGSSAYPPLPSWPSTRNVN